MTAARRASRPPAAIVVLKMASYCDRPFERDRDLADIAHLLDAYEEDLSDRRWEEAAAQSFDVASSFLLGLDLGLLTRERHRDLVVEFLALVTDPDTRRHSLMEQRGPARWRSESEALVRRLEALQAGIRRADER